MNITPIIDKCNEFFQLKLSEDYFNIVYLKDRKEIDKYYGSKTASRLIWFTNKKDTVYILDKENFETESDKKYIPRDYETTIKHEIVHLCFRHKTWAGRPIWLNEWLAIYLSGKLEYRHPNILKFSEFLSFYYEGGKSVYNESWLIVKLLIEKFWTETFKNLIEKIKLLNFKQKDFEFLFKEIYWFDINYENINKYL